MKLEVPIIALVITFVFCSIIALAQTSNPDSPELPGHYFQILEAGITRIEKRLDADRKVHLSLPEVQTFHHFPHAIIIPAVLYSKAYPANKRYKDPHMLQLAERIGDMLVTEYEQGQYTARHDNDWDTYMWLEAYRLLENELGEERRVRWQNILLENLALLEPKLVKSQDYPWYNAPYIITSPNHYAIYASTLLVAGHVFKKSEWVKLATKVLHRFCVKEQTEDGYWGEHSQAGPTTGYNHVTVTQIALYYEYSKDPEALIALRRSTDFHQYFTYPDGTPVETINDRNRYWGVSMWGHFGFSNFPDGRRYATFLTGFFPHGSDTESSGDDIESLGRIAQNVIYYHEGITASIPQDQLNYVHAMKVPAGIRKTGPWVVTYSGIIAPPVSLNNFFLDRQGNFSVFNNKTGLILSGANSKRQPDLATFTEAIGRDSIHMPVSSHFQMNEEIDRLALAYNVFFAILEVPKSTEKQLKFRFITTYKWGDAVSGFNLQFMLKAGQQLETGTGRKIILGEEMIELGDEELGGLIKHNGWTLYLPLGMRLTWPVYPFNPYKNGPETELTKAIGRLSMPLKAENQELPFVLEIE
ncbi:MAG: hypothetical protein IPL46_21835 [Saprospiraceae bacterium]|nr:hypothetical protein [Saprospiraceae bacterium]